MTKIYKQDFVKAKVHAHVTCGEAIKILRELQQLSQNDITRLTGISQSNLSALENNTRQLGKQAAIVIAKALHVHPAVILFPDYEMEDAA